MQSVDTSSAPALSLAHLASATVGEFPVGAVRAQLELSWQQPELYRQAVFDQALRLWPGFTSRPSATIDVFHDLVEVHVGSQRAAFVYCLDGERLTEMSYGELAEQSISLSTRWAEQGVAPGQGVCVVSDRAERRLLGLLAGLRLGARMSVLQPRGRTYVRNRLALLGCDHVAAQGSMAFYGLSQTVLPLLPSRGAGAPRRAHRYDPEAPLMRAVSPLGSGAEALCELTALQCMTRLLSDALLSLAIGAGERVAAVGRERSLVEPSLWLCTLLAGGTFIDLHLQQCEEKPELVGLAGVQLMLAGASLVPFCLVDPARCGERLRRWSVDPAGAVSFGPSWTLSEHLADRGVSTAAHVYCAPLGGVLAFSPRSLRFDALRVLPAPGFYFELKDVIGGDARVPVEQGVLALDGRPAAQAGSLLLAAADHAYGLSGALRPRVSGLPYPEAEVIALVAEHPAVQHAAVVVVPDSVVMNHGSARLLVFVDPYAAPPASGFQSLCDALSRCIHAELGIDPSVTQVEVFALAPRLQGGRVDPVWARGQYVTGALHRKRDLQAFVVLARLRSLFASDSVLIYRKG